MKITWATDIQGDGNSYGYSVHDSMSHRAVQDAGVEIVDDAEIVFHVCPGHLFKPRQGKKNVLYTAWETDSFPPSYIKKYNQADLVIFSASFLAEMGSRVLDVPVELCWEGVDVDFYTYLKRSKNGRPFRFLWVGAPNARKGWELVREAWRFFAADLGTELYVKTTVTDKYERKGNIIWDSRDLSREQLRDLYHQANCFLFPSFGEGFGLTMAEAMATGLPVIYTPWSAMTDLASKSCGYPLRYRLMDYDFGGPTAGPTHLAQANVEHLIKVMVKVTRHYFDALQRGRRAAERIRRFFTWRRTGERLKQILEKHF